MENVNEASVNSIMGGGPADGLPNDGTGKVANESHCILLTFSGVVQMDPWLSPFKDALRHRYSKAQQWIKTIEDTEGGLEKFSRVRATTAFFYHMLTILGHGKVWIQR